MREKAMKKWVCLICTVILFFSVPNFQVQAVEVQGTETSIYGVGVPNWYGGAYSSANPFASANLYGQCTWYAWGRAYERTGKALPCRGNAGTWYNAAANAGYSVGQTPMENSVVVWAYGNYGHVGYVEAVNGDIVTVSEANNSALGNSTLQQQSTLAAGINYYSGMHNWTIAQMGGRYSGERLLGYIYLADKPAQNTFSVSLRRSYYSDESIVASWNVLPGTQKFGFTLWNTFKSDRNDSVIRIDQFMTGTSYTIGKLPPGNYCLGMVPYNSSGRMMTAVVYIDFTVTNRPTVKVSGISLNKTSLTLVKGQSDTITAIVTPSDAANKNIVWKSSNTAIATVSGGTIRAVGTGTATITATAADGSGKTASCIVTVQDAHKHNYKATVLKEPTCMATGTKVYRCSCGASYTETLAKTAHSVTIDKAVAATCTTQGKTQGSHCAVCKKILASQNTIPAKGHSYGKATITKRATKSKNGTAKKKCTRCGHEQSVTVYRPKKVGFSKTTFVYNGKNQKPRVTVYDLNGKALKSGTDYRVSYPKTMKKVGIYTVTVKMIGNYSGTFKKTYSIAPRGTEIKGVTVRSKNSILLKWQKQNSQVDGFEIQCSTDKGFSKGKIRTTGVKGSKKTSAIVKNIKRNQAYYIRIRSYKKVKQNGKTVKVYSEWSEVKSFSYWYK